MQTNKTINNRYFILSSAEKCIFYLNLFIRVIIALSNNYVDVNHSKLFHNCTYIFMGTRKYKFNKMEKIIHLKWERNLTMWSTEM